MFWPLPIVQGAPTQPGGGAEIAAIETVGAMVEADPEIAAHVPVRAGLVGQWALGRWQRERGRRPQQIGG